MSSTPYARTIGALEHRGLNPRATSDCSHESRCPVHDDAQPSLSVTEADDGKVLLHCHAGCGFNSIVAALDMEPRELFPAKDDSPQSRPKCAKPKKNGWVHRTFEEAVESTADFLKGKHLKAEIGDSWVYRWASGDEAMRVQRFNLPNDKKRFSPFHRDAAGWHQSDPPGKLPLFCLDKLASAKRISVFEGEKCAVIGRERLRLNATTSSHGANGAPKTDWTPLAGKKVLIFPDRGGPGERYLSDVLSLVSKLDPRPTIKVIRLSLEHDGDDIEQWLEARIGEGLTDEQAKLELRRIIDETPEWTDGPAPTILKITRGGTDAKDDRAPIEINEKRHVALDATLKAMSRDTELFTRGDSIGIVINEAADTMSLPGGIRLENSRGAPRFVAISDSVLGCRLTKIASFFFWGRDKSKEDVAIDCHPPEWLISAVARHQYWPGIRPLVGTAVSPYVRSDGSIPSAGYDSATGYLFRPGDGRVSVPSQPTREDAIAAGERLFQLVWQFPFATGYDFSVWLAALLTCIQRAIIGGPVPGFAVNGNQAGTGKGLLIDIIGLIVWRTSIPTYTYPAEPAEAAKFKLSLALAGVPVVHLDNLAEGGLYGSSELDSALTSTVVSGRVLGQSRDSGPVPLRPVWFLTGNNVSPSKDAYRRWTVCNLKTELESPHERRDIEIANLRQYVADHRGELLSDALTILRAHAIAGLPSGDWAPLGSFEEWDKSIRGAVWFATENDCLTTQRNATSESPERQDKIALLEGWAELPHGTGDGHTVDDAIRIVSGAPDQFPTLRSAFARLARDGKDPTCRQVGNRIRGMNGQPIGKLKFAKAGERARYALWKVESS